MLQINTYRIGNWVLDKTGSYICIDAKLFLQLKVTDYSNLFSPVLLTSELLYKCGFESPELTFKLRPITLVFLGPEKGFLRVEIDDPYVIQFLHQIQNLYFVETGEEININL